MSFLERWFRRGNWEREMSDELRDHIERQTDANIAAGMPREEARRQAMLQFGGTEAVKEDCREQSDGFWLETERRRVRRSQVENRPAVWIDRTAQRPGQVWPGQPDYEIGATQQGAGQGRRR